ncbi:hypothetical protein K505DRAFT_376861 [Melanomma pulvis-pyrius CBS 109.77]|uniref:WW domain-containing protein n=1 Tax=Melanomma pulvis-pyrius CBS 109.77 TaxID=1314802 RepID=A0A6A6X5E3_9PLEO|nr:hypothetical protein K505DRAFT_376861 [Melanomma pulvis-pyrius CBS 109.77]
MATPRRFEIGTLLGDRWKQWENFAGQHFYEDLNNGAIQYSIPAGYEDSPQDTWTLDTSKGWQEWRNDRTHRIRRSNPNPPPPRTYLDVEVTKWLLQVCEKKNPEPRLYQYRIALMRILSYFFPSKEGFSLAQEPRGEIRHNDSEVDIVVLKCLSPPGGTPHAWDYCLVTTKRPGESWAQVVDQLSRRCGGTDNSLKQVYGIVQVGLEVQFFRAEFGVLTALSERVHLVNDVARVTTLFEYLKHRPLALI